MRLPLIAAWVSGAASLGTWKQKRIGARDGISKVGGVVPHRPMASAADSAGGEEQQHTTLTSLQRQIFCNVELNGANLEAVGFDMDFTLAQYNEEFDMLAFNGAKQKLLSMLNYPQEILDAVSYSSTAFRRGLIIDKLRGNILKVDRHRYVRNAMHGLREMTADERKETYMQSVHSFTESHYAAIDTLFTLVDALLFANLVHLKDASAPSSFLSKKTYEQLYRDIRHCVDLCHRDGAIKDAVMRDPSKYIIYDDGTVHMLQRLKKSGKRTFLLTNSMWEYTQVVMNYLAHGKELSKVQDAHVWQDLFDVIIVGANKPGFLTEEFLSLFEVCPKTGALKNVEDTAAELLTPGNKIFQGGHWQDLHRMLRISSGDRILYVGDHMYSDILRSKRTLGWRTCLIIPELEGEIHTSRLQADKFEEILRTRRLQYDLDEYMDLLRQRIGMGVDAHAQLREAELKAKEIKLKVRALDREFNSGFNQMWGQLFKAGYQESRFAKQVTDYACLYTSRASNLGLCNPNRPFRPVFAAAAHDVAMLDAELYS